ncbi:peptide/nickel transport system substrate-binding protein [Albimonas donghaensis]|uniref:Peptide/nickel transport system substrate-binding protein n=1 Tax=Albimonas donghaensis TaxID=356660 RepID=A0A1H3G7A9_9RHOB|nr:ABC transporter substrate-binding protein [Albimonas donghaensis]SDX98364.1 peptide/nickel transport system substrate-binding protein [Albimonas donghaensis]
MRRLGLVASAAVVLAFAAPSTGVAQEDTLVAAFAAEATTLDPTRYSAGVDTYFIGQMFEQLVKVYPDGSTQNWLAESWELQTGPDGLPIIDVKIRPGVTFHNGDPLTSADFEFVYSRLKDPAISRWSHYQANVSEFEIVDDLHFRLHFSKPDATYVVNNLQLWAMPKKYFEEVGDEAFGQNPVGTGPWKFVSRSIKEELRLEAYDGYWNQEHRPSVKNLVIKVIPEDLTRVAAFQTGEVDWIDAVPPAMLADVKAMDGVATASRVSGNNLYLALDLIPEDSPFRKLKVRQAVAHGFDMDAIIESVLFGQGERYAEVGKGSTGYDPDLKLYDYDPVLAKKLLAEAGYPNGFDVDCINLTTPREPNIKEMGEAMYAYLSTIGIRCKMQNVEYGAWISLGRRAPDTPALNGAMYATMWGHGVPGDPGIPWGGHLHTYAPDGGWGSYSWNSDASLDAAIEESNTIMDPVAREAKLREIGKIKHEQVLGGITTYRPLVTFAWREDKVDYTPWPWPGFWRNFQEIGLKK